MAGGVSSYGGSDPDTVGASGSVASPGALGALANISNVNLPAGVYEVHFGYFLSGTTETATANVRVRKGSTAILSPMPSITGAAPVKGYLPRVTVDGTLTLSVVAIAAATAGAVYNAWIHATRVG